MLYGELRKLAEAAMRRERPDHTLQPTALVHETYVRLADDGGRFENRAHFFGVAASAMRRVLVDHARGAARAEARRRRRLRGGGRSRQPAGSAARESWTWWCSTRPCRGCPTLDSRQGQVVELRFFGGLSVEETAAILDLSARTVKREWQMARAWLRRELAQ